MSRSLKSILLITLSKGLWYGVNIDAQCLPSKDGSQLTSVIHVNHVVIEVKI